MSLQPNDVLRDRYRIEGRLGKGGMGAVYLARDLTLDIQVAVKENLNLNPESERQFKREAKLLAEMRHPNLPRVTDHFILDERQYLVMDYIAGVDLHTRVLERPPSFEEVIAWGLATCDALEYLHRLVPPIIHRDIKPANLKVQPDGRVVLVDFGIAKVSDQGQTTTGARGLTPGFSPPEQYGDQRTDARSDQYSLAATLYSLVTGQKPADSIQRMLGKEELRPARQYDPAIPEYLDAALTRALALDKDARFATITDFKRALQGELALETIRAPQAEVHPTAVRRSRRGIWIGAGTAGIVLVAAGITIGLSGGLPFNRPTPTGLPEPTELVAAVMPGDTPTATPSATPGPTETPQATFTPSPSATPTTAPVVLGGSTRIAFVSDREDGVTLQVWMMNPDGSGARQVTFGPGDKAQPRWSPDGQRLLYVAPGGIDLYGNDLGRDIFLINLDGSIDPINLTQSLGDDTDPAWSPDGTQLAFTGTRVNGQRQVFLMALACEPLPAGCTPAGSARNLSAGYAVEYFPAWSPDGLRLAVAASINGAPGRILLRLADGEAPALFDLQDRIQGAEQITWSSDGAYLAFSWIIKRGKQEIYIAALANPGLDPISLTNSLGNKEPDFSPDTQWIVFTSTRDQNPEIYIMTNNGTGQMNLTNHPGRDLQPDWQPQSAP
jgi:Tol biopolymer transport system component/predicted Ser/Thr protein kinase